MDRSEDKLKDRRIDREIDRFLSYIEQIYKDFPVEVNLMLK